MLEFVFFVLSGSELAENCQWFHVGIFCQLGATNMAESATNLAEKLGRKATNLAESHKLENSLDLTTVSKAIEWFYGTFVLASWAIGGCCNSFEMGIS